MSPRYIRFGLEASMPVLVICSKMECVNEFWIHAPKGADIRAVRCPDCAKEMGRYVVEAPPKSQSYIEREAIKNTPEPPFPPPVDPLASSPPQVSVKEHYEMTMDYLKDQWDGDQ